MIERGVIITAIDEFITSDHLFPRMEIDSRRDIGTTSSISENSNEKVLMLKTAETLFDNTYSLDDIEAKLIERAVASNNGNLSSAARQLGITRPQLDYRIKKRKANI